MSDNINRKISVGLVDLKLNNIFSIANCLKKLGYKTEIIEKQKKIKSDIIILPGVGAFAKAMKYLKFTELDKKIIEYYQKNRPIVGICLGMQLLFEKSEEFKITNGLGLIKGNVKKIPDHLTTRPNIGWQKIKIKKNNLLFNKKFSNKYFYFIHSYYCIPKYENEILSTTSVNKFQFCSSIKKNKVYGMQFHPEKSSDHGLKIFKNLRNLL